MQSPIFPIPPPIRTPINNPLQWQVGPFTVENNAASLKELRNRTAAVNLGDEVLKLGILVSARDISLDLHFQGDALPVRVSLRAGSQYRRRKDTLDGDLPLSELDAMILGDDETGHLVARAQTGKGVRDGRRSLVLAAEDGVSIGGEGIRLVLDAHGLLGARASTSNLESDALAGGCGCGELAEAGDGLAGAEAPLRSETPSGKLSGTGGNHG